MTKKPLDEMLRVLKLEGQAILASAERLSKSPELQKQVDQAVVLLQKALTSGGKIVVTGVGKSGKIAQKIAATLSSTGSLAVFLHPTEGLHGDLGMVTSKDVILALSYTGNTDELLQLVPAFKRLGVAMIGMGGNSQSRLASESSAWIDVSVEQEACPHNLAPTSSSTLALAMGDALAVTLMQVRGFDADAFARNHPGGALGRRLTLSVQDVMHGGSTCAVLGPEASMEEVVLRSTDKKLGAVLITEGGKLPGKLAGIITDGDLRRALSHKEKFFSLKAREVMTKTPVTVSAQAMAQAAVELMQNRPSQISVLPVVNAQSEAVGLVRLHDLVKSL